MQTSSNEVVLQSACSLRTMIIREIFHGWLKSTFFLLLLQAAFLFRGSFFELASFAPRFSFESFLKTLEVPHNSDSPPGNIYGSRFGHRVFECNDAQRSKSAPSSGRTFFSSALGYHRLRLQVPRLPRREHQCKPCKHLFFKKVL